ncbi:hypothetical protein ACXDF8_05785 [Mycolicibacterium sp. CBM1]
MSETVTETTQIETDSDDDQQTVGAPTGTETVALDDAATDENAETFPRSVVEKLRTENGKHRQNATQANSRADALATRLHAELVRATGRLADPADLAFDAEHLDDADALSAAIDALLDAKPHLASRRPTGDIGQGNRGPATAGFSLLDALKART